MNPFKDMTGEQIKDTWQSKALQASDAKICNVLMCVFSKEYAAAFPVLFYATFGKTADLSFPFLSGYASIAPSGRLICNQMIGPHSLRKVEVYESEGAFILDMRKLADKMKLSDADRTDMFRVLQKWVTQDLRPKRMASLA